MEEKNDVSLPENWNAMFQYEQVLWFIKEFGTDDDDDDGNMIFDTEKMSEEVLEAYKGTIEAIREARKQGILLD